MAASRVCSPVGRPRIATAALCRRRGSLLRTVAMIASPPPLMGALDRGELAKAGLPCASPRAGSSRGPGLHHRRHSADVLRARRHPYGHAGRGRLRRGQAVAGQARRPDARRRRARAGHLLCGQGTWAGGGLVLQPSRRAQRRSPGPGCRASTRSTPWSAASTWCARAPRTRRGAPRPSSSRSTRPTSSRCTAPARCSSPRRPGCRPR
jgi:hypothetical protein